MYQTTVEKKEIYAIVHTKIDLILFIFSLRNDGFLIINTVIYLTLCKYL